MKDFILIGLKGNDLQGYYNNRFNRWLFDNSDEVKMDGDILTDIEKKTIKLSGYNIKPQPKEIWVSKKTNGSDLTEELFLEIEINIIESLSPSTVTKMANKKDYLNFLKAKKEKIDTTSLQKDITKEIWFQVGVKFATGEMKELLNNNNGIAAKASEILGKEMGLKAGSIRPYISDTNGNNNKTSNKNIYNNRSKMLAIIKHCEENNLSIIAEFKEAVPQY
ncbi:MAG: hypothetical protein KDC62_08750 [Aequorivita sp.]|nr:hypothetical protein [Aequorivita sp.]